MPLPPVMPSLLSFPGQRINLNHAIGNRQHCNKAFNFGKKLPIKATGILITLLILLGCQSRPTPFVNLTDELPEVILDLRYAGSDNFVGSPIDGYEAGKCLITHEAAEALEKVQVAARAQGLQLKVFDAYRPQRAVDHFVRWAKDLDDTLMKARYYPEVKKSELFEKGYIAAKSGHSRGSTIDLTLVDEQGIELDMGTGWDYFGPASWPGSDAVTPEQKDNRMLLRLLMVEHGFKPLKEEWWHFTLKNEPFPETYFDIVAE